MMTAYNKIKSTIGILLFILYTTMMSCVMKQEKESAIVLPKLLDRNEALRYGKEWDKIQSTYVGLRDKIKKDPDDLSALLQLAHLYINEARVTGEHGHYYPAALCVTQKILDSKKIDNDMKFNANVTKAGVQLSLHNFAEALSTGNDAMRYNPQNAQLLGVMVDANVELGQYNDAIKMADAMVALRPDLRSYSRVSYLREIFGDVKGAKQAMLMAIQAGYPGYDETAWCMHTYGSFLLKYNQIKEAEAVYAELLDSRPNFAFALEAQAQISISKKDDKTALILLDKAIDIIPEVGFYITKAQLLKKQNKAMEVTNITSEILDMLADDEKAGHNMDLTYAQVYDELRNDPQTALKYALHDYERRPNNVEVNLVMAKLAQRNNKYTEAKRYLEVASKTKSKDPEILALQREIASN